MISPWAGCSLPRADDYLELGDINLEGLNVHQLLDLSRSIGISPSGAVDGSPLTKEVLVQHLRLFTESA